MKKHAVTNKVRPASITEIRSIVGPLDKTILQAILQVGATPDEIVLAFQWLEENHYTRSSLSRRMSGKIRSVYDILDYERNFLNGKVYGH